MNVSQIVKASLPDTRTTAIPPTPGAVEIAQIVIIKLFNIQISEVKTYYSHFAHLFN